MLNIIQQGFVPLQPEINYPTADSYVQLDPRTHVYIRPDMYIGADSRSSRQEWLLKSNNTMSTETIDLVPGVERLFLEIESNSSDNVGKSRRAGLDPGYIEIRMDQTTISVTNYGLPIATGVNKQTGKFAPEMIFGSMLSGSSYEGDRHEAGTNGIGAKAVNIFSKYFKVVIHNHITKEKYTQVWENNMLVCHPPQIEEYIGTISSTEIVYIIDFVRFGYTSGCYPDEAFGLFARHAADTSFTAKVPVIFNDRKFNFCDIREYARLYFGEAVETSILHYQWPNGTEIISKKGPTGKTYQTSKNPNILPIIELIAIDTPDEGLHVSFVNCMMTRDGGVHVNNAIKAIGDSSVNLINETTLKKLTKQNKGKELDAKDKRAYTITINDVKPHISILLNTKLINPKFTSQTKTALHSPSPKIEIAEQELQGISRWKLINRLYTTLENKQYNNLAKGGGKLVKNLALEKGLDANNAAGPYRKDCELIICEGKSALSYVYRYIDLIPNGKDTHGSFPMKGKPYNVMGKKLFQVEKNAELKELMKMLGLTFGVDYTIPINFDKLRYGGITIMADSDVDGKHIVGLVINFFHCLFSSLLAIGFVKYYKTPTIRVARGNLSYKFYTKKEYDDWAKDNNINYWVHDYYKGLGSSTNEQVKEDFTVRRIIGCYYDPLAPETIRLVFAKDQTNKRKEWIKNWDSIAPVQEYSIQPISHFINHEMILFSIADIQRSIPKLMDGMKEVQRKILSAVYDRWNIKQGGKDYKKYKVGRFGHFAADKTCYQHGEVILGEVIVKMCQDYIGANNITWFTKEGQFGCLHPLTPVLLWNGTKKLAKDIVMEDKLIGDDGKIRNILQLVSGEDHMYKIKQSYGEDYVVNSLHILTLCFPKHREISWNDHCEEWYAEYYDRVGKCISYISLKYCDRVQKYLDKVDKDNIFDISLREFLSWPNKWQDKITSVAIIDKKIRGGKIEIEHIGIGPYVGWYLDGNKRFLLGDSTVTHNSRYELGEDAADTRYSGIKPESLMPYIFRKEDEPLLDILIDEGEKIEPNTYYPLIPLALVNGVVGIGTGHSSTIPNHDPLVIIQWIKAKLQGVKRKDLPKVLPWYRGFTGMMTVIDRRSKKSRQNKVKIIKIDNKSPSHPILNIINKTEEEPKDIDEIISESGSNSSSSNSSDEDEKKPKVRPLLSMVTTGSFHMSRNVVVITEFPIRKSPIKYRKNLEKLAEKGIITGFRDMCKDDFVGFEIYGMLPPINERTLKLKKTMGMSNMVLLDENNQPIRYDTVYDILRTFYKKRLPIYQQRKDYIIPQLLKEVETLKHKIKYVTAVVNKELNIVNVNKAVIYTFLNKIGVPKDIYDKSKAKHFSKEDILILTEKIAKKDEQRRIIENTSPQQMWLKELDELEIAYCNRYNIRRPNKPQGVTLNIVSNIPVTPLLNIIRPVSLNIIK